MFTTPNLTRLGQYLGCIKIGIYYLLSYINCIKLNIHTSVAMSCFACTI